METALQNSKSLSYDLTFAQLATLAAVHTRSTLSKALTFPGILLPFLLSLGHLKKVIMADRKRAFHLQLQTIQEPKSAVESPHRPPYSLRLDGQKAGAEPPEFDRDTIWEANGQKADVMRTMKMRWER